MNLETVPYLCAGSPLLKRQLQIKGERTQASFPLFPWRSFAYWEGCGKYKDWMKPSPFRAYLWTLVCFLAFFTFYLCFLQFLFKLLLFFKFYYIFSSTIYPPFPLFHLQHPLPSTVSSLLFMSRSSFSFLLDPSTHPRPAMFAAPSSHPALCLWVCLYLPLV